MFREYDQDIANKNELILKEIYLPLNIILREQLRLIN